MAKNLSKKNTQMEDEEILKSFNVKTRKSKNDRQRDNINALAKKYKHEKEIKRLMWDGLGCKPGTHS